jgi:hypothetical protein
MRRLAILLALASCTGASSDTGDDGSPSGRSDARAAAAQMFECSGRRVEMNGAQALTWHFASIGKLNPADAPAVDAWICDFTCQGTACVCAEGSDCTTTGDPVRADAEGWCTSAEVRVRPNGEAIVPCGFVVAGSGNIAARAYVRM